MSARDPGQEERLLRQVVPPDADLAAQEVLRAAMRAAMDVTHEAGTPEATDEAVLQTFWSAIRAARVAPSTTATPPAQPSPDCECGHAESEHLEPYSFSVSRACAADGGCDCIAYVPAAESTCNCGAHECGGCYPSAHW